MQRSFFMVLGNLDRFWKHFGSIVKGFLGTCTNIDSSIQGNSTWTLGLIAVILELQLNQAGYM